MNMPYLEYNESLAFDDQNSKNRNVIYLLTRALNFASYHGNKNTVIVNEFVVDENSQVVRLRISITNHPIEVVDE